MLHIPILRYGRPYRSLDVLTAPHYRTGEPFVEVSQANAGLIRRDLLRQGEARRILASLSCSRLIEICREAARHFAESELPLGDSVQSPEDYVRQVAATTGLPRVMVRRNMAKIASVLAEMESVVAGLTRGLDLSLLDRGYGEFNGKLMSFYPRSDALGVVLPSNSPGVHTLWIPSVALKTPLVLKPGSGEPWSPYRVIQALIRAGCPPEAFSYYPTDHSSAGEVLRGCGRAMVFGDASTTRPWQRDPRVEVHGPGFSKVILGADAAREWEKHLDLIVTSVLENSGRSCINASGVWLPSHGEEVALALAERLAGVRPRAEDDDGAELAPFANPAVAGAIAAGIEAGLLEEGAYDVTARFRSDGPLVEWEGCSYLLPTVVFCEDPGHPLANREYLFPFCSVVQVPEDRLPEALGPSLVVTAVTGNRDLRERLVRSPLVDRLNLGPIPTNRIGWDQPHEGNLFEHLYARRAFQVRSGAA